MKSFWRENRRKLLAALAASFGVPLLVTAPGYDPAPAVFVGVFLLLLALIIWRWNPVAVPRVLSAKAEAKAAERAAREACVAHLRRRKLNPGGDAAEEIAEPAADTRTGAETTA